MSTEPFRGIDADFVTEIGRVTIAGTAVEDVVYRVAECLGKELRGLSAADAARAICEHVRREPLPPWVAGNRPQVCADLIQWTGEVLPGLDERHSLVHARYFSKYNGSAWVQYHERTGGKASKARLDLRRARKVVKRLTKLENEGTRLERQLLPELAPSVHYIPWGPRAGAVAVMQTGGEYPWPQKDELDGWVAQFHARFGQR